MKARKLILAAVLGLIATLTAITSSVNAADTMSRQHYYVPEWDFDWCDDHCGGGYCCADEPFITD